MEQHLYLAHHGIKGQKWGVRRFRNKDGTLTQQGKERYGDDSQKQERSLKEKATEFYKNHETEIKIGIAVAGTALALYGAYKLYQNAPIKQYGALTYAKSDPLSATISSYSDVAPSIPKNVTFHRISRDAFADYSDAGSAYVSYKFRDNAKYVLAGKNNLTFPGGERRFIHEFSPNRAVRVPSAKTLAEMYLRQYPDATDQQFRYTVTQGFIQWNAEQLADPVTRHTVARANEFRQTLLSMGYDAIVDLEDAGSRGVEAPLILLNPSEMSSTARGITQAERVIASLVRRR